jgi:hypothetical protein
MTTWKAYTGGNPLTRKGETSRTLEIFPRH